MRPTSLVPYRALFLVPALALVACGGRIPPKVEMVPIGTNAPNVDEDKYPANKPPPVVDNGAPKGCVVNDTEELEDWLKNEKCKVPSSDKDGTTGLSQKLDLKLTASTPEISPGGRVDLTLSIKNKSSEQVTLVFLVDGPAFRTQTWDAKNKQVGMPNGKPKAPSGAIVDEDATRTVKILVGSGGTLKTKLHWDAVKLKWAPEKVEGAASTPGTFPTAPAGNLPLGKYTVRLATTMSGISDDSLPRVPIEVVKE